MKASGGCYCKELRYDIDGPVQAAAQCHCRECQYFTGGAVNTLMAFSESNVHFTKGTVRTFARTDLDTPVERFFCPTCGTHLGGRSTNRPAMLIIRVGTLDDPSIFRPQAAIFMCDAQPFHNVEEGLPAFDKRP